MGGAGKATHFLREKPWGRGCINQSSGTRHLAKSRHGQAICQLFEMKRFFLFIGNLAECIEENVSTREKRRHAAG